MTRLIPLLCLFFLSTILIAQVSSPTISVQGTLKNAEGTSVADGTRSITFRLYQQADGGNPVWEETANDVRVVGGIYSHQLGTVVPLNGGNFDRPVYLGVVVDGLELSPRTQMSYAPYALSVAFAQGVAPGGCSGQVGDIKYSILRPDQFQQENGDCWVPMDGRSIAGTKLANVYGWTTLPQAGGQFLRAHEFDGQGDVDVDRNFNSPVGQTEGDQNKSHSHGMQPAGNHSHSYSDSYLREIQVRDQDTDNSTVPPNDANDGSWLLSRNGRMTYNRDAAFRWQEFENDGSDRWSMINTISNLNTGNAGNHTHVIEPEGGPEARPKNISFFLYIRVN
ncbi:MAG: hypothetical protein AAGA62_03655 [Bacteroidota bacterium]